MAQIAHQMKDKDWVYILDRLMAEIVFVIVEKSGDQKVDPLVLKGLMNRQIFC